MSDLIRILDSTETHFDQKLSKLLYQNESERSQLVGLVAKIITDVRNRGDLAVVEYTKKFDNQLVEFVSDLEVKKREFEKAWSRIADEQRVALETAARRVFDFHSRQLTDSWQYCDGDGNLLGQRVTPLDTVGVYVPGGKASYPSSVLMNVIPAKVAGVREILMLVPAPSGELNDAVLAAAHIAGVDRCFMLGGAQAIAGLAYGTKTLPAVDKIVGPGNRYVAEAKRQVFGRVGIDMIAGPSEILIICDGHTPPDWIAMDIFSQAEHDDDARAFLICPDRAFVESVLAQMEEQLPRMERKTIIKKALSKNSAVILTKDLEAAIEISNRIAPEHLELSIQNPEDFLPKITSAGAIFMGKYTSESLGDYCAGPSHVLPTGGAAKFSSPLGVYDFQKRSSVIMCTETSAQNLYKTASTLARIESLTAHAYSAELRLSKSSE